MVPDALSIDWCLTSEPCHHRQSRRTGAITVVVVEAAILDDEWVRWDDTLALGG